MQDSRKNYEIVVHTLQAPPKSPPHIFTKYYNEIYYRDSSGNLRYVPEEKARKIVYDKEYDTIYEMIHAYDYERVKSPFSNDKGETLWLFGRYINISSRRTEQDARF